MPNPDFNAISRQMQATIRRLPKIVGNEGKNFFLDRFQQQNWIGNTTQPWPSRKVNKWGKKGRNRKGRALLVMTGRLRRSIRYTNSADTIRFYTDVPYTRANNEGFRGTVTQQVDSFKRTQTFQEAAAN
ncbi:MAG: hypothetical protein EAY75_06325 [Bacteroidetes bacterium]|nr:MAG: hypothetical protein EAY75_06325 [Bacteroidota bacterium]